MARAAADPDRLLIVEINPAAPRTMGLPPEYRHAVHMDQIDVLVESDRPMFVLPDAEATDVDQRIAANVRPFITDGATLQTGIGGIPSTIATMLAEDDGGDYGVHSEMFTNGLMRLHKAGKISNLRKGQFERYSITTFAAGTVELYEFLDGNTEVRFLPVEVVNSPEIVSRNARMVTINGALTIDLWGQAVADTIGPRQFSGIGGHEDFVSVAGFELEDRSLLCLPSTAIAGGQRISRIAAELAAGAVVTTPRHQLDLVVTEFGVASLRGRTVHERAVALAEVAHPDFRDDLLGHADTLR
jgi:acyl-CoA hydrolase